MNEVETFPIDLHSALDEARSGEQQGLAELFEFFHPRLLRYLRAREPSRADDIAANTWISVASGIGEFRGDVGNFSAWLFTIARRRLADHRRAAVRRGAAALPLAEDRRLTDSTEDDALGHMSGQMAVDFIVSALSHDQAEVVLLRVLAGLGPAEVARAMGRDEVWVRVNYHRAIARLRDRLPVSNVGLTNSV